MSVEVMNESAHEVDVEEFAELGRFLIDQLHIHPQAELAITFVDPDVMEQYHIEWLDLPGPTDVMSWPMDEIRPGRDGEVSEPGILGDIVVCPQVAAEQARAAGHSTVEEMLLLTVHGFLHLLGYDHEELEDEKVMFAMQRTLLLSFLAGR